MLKSNRYHPNIKEIISLNDLAVKYYKEKNIQKAYKVCREIYELEPAPDILKQSVDLGIEHMRYHMILGETYYKKGNYAEAQKILNSLHDKYAGEMLYLGTWHSHPEDMPSPSGLHISEWDKIVEKNDQQIPNVFAIVGRKESCIFVGKNGEYIKLEKRG